VTVVLEAMFIRALELVRQMLLDAHLAKERHSGVLAADVGDTWLDEFVQATERGPLLFGATLFTVAGQKPRMGVFARAVLMFALLAVIAAFNTGGGAPATAYQLHQFSVAPALNNRQDFQGFVDPIMADAMQRWHVPGGGILVVQDDDVVFSKGYGYADVERQVPVSPETTVFHVLSLSKLLTATAIMQLVEQGRLDLNSDVNTYLTELHIGDPYLQPITIRDLLTHTAGFDSDQREIGGSARTTVGWLPLDRYLAKRAVVPMWPPGQQFLYTNAAYDLLGLVIQDVSAVPFADYMAQHILQPLEMERSTFDQPSPFRSDLAVTYHYVAGYQTIVLDGMLFNVPAAGLSATAADMAHFMIAHLPYGQYAHNQILQTSTVQEMHQPHFTYDPDQPAMAYGFRAALSPRSNGSRDPPPAGTPVLWHEGGGPRASTSYLQLRPQDGSGLFLAFNTDQFEFLDQVLDQFEDRFDPLVSDASETTPQQTAAGNSNLTRFAGVYRPVDYSRKTISKLLLLQADDLPEVVVNGNALGIRWLRDAPA
jgi:CubicO group peptidase (beta-lactamase class C family)